jgi:predicted PhzF superfamily epimerase YddE/YHI9
MDSLRLYQIDAFASKVFRGNPAAVCPLPTWLDDSILQATAEENNLSETAFFVPKGGVYDLRWFTPRYEVDLCGHATLAAAFVILTELGAKDSRVCFESCSGPLDVVQDGRRLCMNFPALTMIPCPDPPTALLDSLNILPKEVFRVAEDTNYFAIYGREEDVKAIKPSLSGLERLHPYGVAISAPGQESDCVSRYFAPSYGIPEDPVTGSIHCALVPYWAKQLSKKEIYARQLSRRGGELFCELAGNRVRIAGYAAKYLEGEIYL